jgi:hypothetical protein
MSVAEVVEPLEAVSPVERLHALVAADMEAADRLIHQHTASANGIYGAQGTNMG